MDIYQILENLRRVDELDLLAPRSTYFKMPNGAWIQGDYRGTQGMTGHGADDATAFTSFNWVPHATVTTLGLDKKTGTPNAMGGTNPHELVPNQNIGGNGPLSNRSVDVIDFAKAGPDDIPASLKSKLIQWVQKNPQKVDETEFPGYWTGKMSAKQARGHMVGDGGAAESIEQRLQSKWKQHLEEFGADNTGGTAGNSTTTATATANPTDPAANADTAVDATNIQKGLNKLKSAGVDLPTGVTQATQTVLKGPGDVQNTQDRQTTMALGNTIADLLQKGDPSSQNQLAAMIQKIEQSRKQQ